MFGKLKEKLAGWAKKLTEKKQEETPEIVEDEKILKSEESQDEVVDTKKSKKILEKEFETKKPKEKVKHKPKTKKEKAEEIENEIETPQTIPSSQEEIVDTKEDKKILEEEFEVIEEPQEKKKGFFKRFTEKIVTGYTRISEEEFSEYSEDLEMLLLENNVALEVTDKIISELKIKITEKEISKKDLEEEIKKSLKEIIEEILVEPFDLLEKIKENKSKSKDPYIILLCGINGSGKTTTIAKIAYYLKKNKLSCIAAAGDTFRAASIEQIKKHGEKLDFKVIAHDYGADPSAVGFDAIQYAKKNKIDVVLIDTAGRMHTAKNLLKEMEKIVRICNPDTKIFVGESITGNDSVEQVKAFDEVVNLDGIILTKADIDEKGGTALSVGHVTGKPILFLGMGQEYSHLEPFDKKKFIGKLGL